jgi:chromosome segregation ATPase
VVGIEFYMSQRGENLRTLLDDILTPLQSQVTSMNTALDGLNTQLAESQQKLTDAERKLADANSLIEQLKWDAATNAGDDLDKQQDARVADLVARAKGETPAAGGDGQTLPEDLPAPVEIPAGGVNDVQVVDDTVQNS